LLRAAPAWSLIRKTSLQDRTDNPLRSSNGLTKHLGGDPLLGHRHECAGSAHRMACGHHDARNDLLFTMSDNTRRRPARETCVSRVHQGKRTRICFLRTSDPHEARLRQATAGSLRFHRLASRSCKAAKAGGARRDRTDDLLLAKQALSQLSYGP
jgi:hypothetical protein